MFVHESLQPDVSHLSDVPTQYTVTMFIIDVSPSMGDLRLVQLPPGPDGEARSVEMTNLEWSLKYVKLKIQQMVCTSISNLLRAIEAQPIIDIRGPKNRSLWRCLIRHSW